MKNLLLVEKHFEEDPPKVEHLLVQTVARYFYDPILQDYPQHNKTYSTFLHIKEKLEELAVKVDTALGELSHISDFRVFVEVGGSCRHVADIQSKARHTASCPTGCLTYGDIHTLVFYSMHACFSIHFTDILQTLACLMGQEGNLTSRLNIGGKTIT
jgi:hypothetical protein